MYKYSSLQHHRYPGDIFRGFTLIELSISLVIIGLIVGGILGARDLIRQAELRSVISDIQGFKTVINTFQLKYDALPGDMRNATDYWSGGNNGDGDGRIEDLSGDDWEGFHGWKQLTDSGILQGSYQGAPSGGVDIGVDLPAAPIEPGGYRLNYTGVQGKATNYISFATRGGGSDATLTEPIINTPDAVAIDEKMDDGIAAGGLVWGYDGWISGASWSLGCVDRTPNPDIYDLSNTDIHCVLHFVLN